MMDDLHYDDLGCYGSDLAHTPNIDRLARQGLRFTRYYASGPVCTPTRAALLTGLYPQRLNLRTVVRVVGYPGPVWRSAGSRRGIPAHVTTIAELLRARGYRTAHMGKWHLGHDKPEFPAAQQGFDRSIVTLAGGRVRGGRQSIYHDVVLQYDGAERQRSSGHLAKVLTDHALEFIRSNASRPFFLNLWLVSPHTPLEPPASYAARYPDSEPGRLAAMVAHVDAQVGRIVATLGKLGLKRNTLIVVTADNGGDGKTHASSGPLRGFKGTLFEGGIRVPMIARWPGTIRRRSTSDEVIASIDLLPTFAQLAGADTASLELDGRSFAGTLLGRDQASAPPRALIWNYGHTLPNGFSDSFAVRRGRWKLYSVDRQTLSPENDGEPEGALQPATHNRETLLFDVNADPGETTDRAHEEPATVEALRDEYERWKADAAGLGFAIEGLRGDLELTRRDPLEARFGSGGAALLLERDPLVDFHDGDFTFALWVRPSLSPGTKTSVIASKADSWSLTLDPNLRLTLALTEDGDGSTVLMSSRTLTAGSWHHVGFVVRGGPRANSRVQLYLDGILEARDSSLIAIRAGSEQLVLGAEDAALSRPFHGDLRELRLFLLPLDDDEIAALHHQGAGPALPG